MANLFDADNAPTIEPDLIVVGDFIQWKRTDLVADYPTATHSAEYVARISGGGADEIKLAMTETETYYLATVDSATSAAFTPGKYYWQLEITETASGNRIVVDRGSFTATPDLDNNQADPRSHAEKMITKIESLLEGRADSDVASYSINGRSLTKLSIADLREWRDYYRRELAKQNAIEARRRGMGSSNKILARF